MEAVDDGVKEGLWRMMHSKDPDDITLAISMLFQHVPPSNACWEDCYWLYNLMSNVDPFTMGRFNYIHRIKWWKKGQGVDFRSKNPEIVHFIRAFSIRMHQRMCKMRTERFQEDGWVKDFLTLNDYDILKFTNTTIDEQKNNLFKH